MTNEKKGLSDAVIIAIVNGIKDVILGIIGKAYDYKCQTLNINKQKFLE